MWTTFPMVHVEVQWLVSFHHSLCSSRIFSHIHHTNVGLTTCWTKEDEFIEWHQLLLLLSLPLWFLSPHVVSQKLHREVMVYISKAYGLLPSDALGIIDDYAVLQKLLRLYWSSSLSDWLYCQITWRINFGIIMRMKYPISMNRVILSKQL